MRRGYSAVMLGADRRSTSASAISLRCSRDVRWPGGRRPARANAGGRRSSATACPAGRPAGGAGSGTTRPGSAVLPGTRPLRWRTAKRLSLGGQFGARERIQLFDAHDRDVGDAALLRVFEQVVVDLAAAARTTRRDLLRDPWRWCPGSGAGTRRWPGRPASRPTACGAAATSASSPPAACACSRSICRRSMWNICAGVVGTQTCMLSSAHSCRKRSRRAELCSGPWPS